MNRNWLFAGLALVALAVAFRLVPHAANFTPLYAVALLACATFPRSTGFWVPLVAMVISDLVVGMHDTVLFTWSGMLVFMALGYALSGTRTATRIGLYSLAGSAAFFVWTNFGVWLVSGMYAPSASGLAQCYLLALPFFRNSLLGDLAFTAALFAAYELVRRQQISRVAVVPARF